MADTVEEVRRAMKLALVIECYFLARLFAESGFMI